MSLFGIMSCFHKRISKFPKLMCSSITHASRNFYQKKMEKENRKLNKIRVIVIPYPFFRAKKKTKENDLLLIKAMIFHI